MRADFSMCHYDSEQKLGWENIFVPINMLDSSGIRDHICCYLGTLAESMIRDTLKANFCHIFGDILSKNA